MSNRYSVRDQAVRKTFNAYLDIKMVDLLDEWAKRDGTSRSALIELAIEQCFLHNNLNGVYGKLRCTHEDLNRSFFESQGIEDYKLVEGVFGSGKTQAQGG